MDKQPNDERLIPVGISSCLLGEEVRYDGGHKYNPTIVTALNKHFRFIPFCPEVDIGLGVPRDPIHLVVVGDQTRCVDAETSTQDVTDRLINSADRQRDWQDEIYGYILKRGSPSCGMQGVKLWSNGSYERSGVGIYANRVMQNFPALPVEEEGSLDDEVLREEFIQKVLSYHRSRMSELI